MSRTLALLVLGMSCAAVETDASDPSNPNEPQVDNTEVDADTDADTDSDPPVDTGPPVTWAGTYSGLIGANISYQEANNSGVIVYACTGPFVVFVTGASPGLTGTGTCADHFSGEVLSIELVGDVTTFPAATGDLTVDHPEFEFAGNTRPAFVFTGAFGGTFEAEEFTTRATEMIVGPPTINWYVNFTLER